MRFTVLIPLAAVVLVTTAAPLDPTDNPRKHANSRDVADIAKWQSSASTMATLVEPIKTFDMVMGLEQATPISTSTNKLSWEALGEANIPSTLKISPGYWAINLAPDTWPVTDKERIASAETLVKSATSAK